MNDNEHKRFMQWDAAYVLGALTPADRKAYENHLEECSACRDAVGELASMPGLLARITPETETEKPDPPPPADLLERMLQNDQQQRRNRRRRRMIGWAAAAAAALVLAIAVPAALMLRAPDEETVAVALEPVETIPTEFRVEVGLEPTEWGTHLSIECDYPPGTDYQAQQTWYALVVTDTDGTSSQVSTWQAVAGQTVNLDAATAVDLEDITSLSVVTATGETVLTAPVPG